MAYDKENDNHQIKENKTITKINSSKKKILKMIS